jgi:hypothetical protein
MKKLREYSATVVAGRHRQVTVALLLIVLAAGTGVGIAAGLRSPTTVSRSVSPTRAHPSVMTAQQAIALVMPPPQDGVTKSAAKLTTWEKALETGSPGASVPGSPEPLAARVWVVAFSVKYLPPWGLTRTPPDHWVAYVVDQKTGSNPEVMSGPATWPPFFDSLHDVSRQATRT